MLRNSITIERERDSSLFCFFFLEACFPQVHRGPACCFCVVVWIDLQTGRGLDAATMGKEEEIKEEWKMSEGKKERVCWADGQELEKCWTFQSCTCLPLSALSLLAHFLTDAQHVMLKRKVSSSMYKQRRRRTLLENSSVPPRTRGVNWPLCCRLFI